MLFCSIFRGVNHSSGKHLHLEPKTEITELLFYESGTVPTNAPLPHFKTAPDPFSLAKRLEKREKKGTRVHAGQWEVLLQAPKQGL